MAANSEARTVCGHWTSNASRLRVEQGWYKWQPFLGWFVAMYEVERSLFVIFLYTKRWSVTELTQGLPI